MVSDFFRGPSKIQQQTYKPSHLTEEAAGTGLVFLSSSACHSNVAGIMLIWLDTLANLAQPQTRTFPNAKVDQIPAAKKRYSKKPVKGPCVNFRNVKPWLWIKESQSTTSTIILYNEYLHKYPIRMPSTHHPSHPTASLPRNRSLCPRSWVISSTKHVSNVWWTLLTTSKPSKPPCPAGVEAILYRVAKVWNLDVKHVQLVLMLWY